MKSILIAASLLLINTAAHSQGFQIGFASGLATNFPDNSQKINYPEPSTATPLNTYMQTGIFVRYELRNRLALQLNALEYSNSYHYFQAIDYPANTYPGGDSGISKYTSGIIRVNNYLLDLSLQININSSRALHNAKFRGVKSYIGISYTGIVHHLDGQGIFYDAMTKQTSVFEAKNNMKDRAIGLNYYGSYAITRHFTLSLQAALRMSTAALSLVDNGSNSVYFVDPRNNVVSGWHGDYTSTLSIGIAYKF